MPERAISRREELPRTSRYELLVKIASGGMATVYVGKLRGAEGFSRRVAIKRAHPHLVEDPTFRRMLITEALLAAQIHHPNAVSVLDVEDRDGELLLIMDFVEGAALSTLLSAAIHDDRPLSPAIGARVVLDAALGLHAAHTLTDDDGRDLGLVHRDVSPHNILVGQDGVGRITDFGIAKCVTSNTATNATATGVLKGKLAYMAPEYIEHGDIDARGDVFALGVVLWEALTNQRLFRAPTEMETMRRVSSKQAPRVSTAAPWVGSALDAVVARALSKSPDRRFPDARSFAEALESAARRADLLASASAVGDHVRAVAGEEITARRAALRERADEHEADEAPPPSATTTAIDAPLVEGSDLVSVVSVASPQRLEIVPEPADPETAALPEEPPTRPLATPAIGAEAAREMAPPAADQSLVSAPITLLRVREQVRPEEATRDGRSARTVLAALAAVAALSAGGLAITRLSEPTAARSMANPVTSAEAIAGPAPIASAAVEASPASAAPAGSASADPPAAATPDNKAPLRKRPPRGSAPSAAPIASAPPPIEPPPQPAASASAPRHKAPPNPYASSSASAP